MEWHNWLTTQVGGRTQQGIAQITTFLCTLGTWNDSSQARGYDLKKAYHSQDQILTGAARDGVYAVNLKLIAQGNWRNVSVISYQKGINLEAKLVRYSVHSTRTVNPNPSLQSADLKK